ncbi:MAG: hypothetical protein KAI02_00505 [Gammaproteobacteria bacterium]|nr:hypothetical protein [Gammaproteobacteria bacterium]
MKYSLVSLVITFLLNSSTLMASRIIQCQQADGSIEFTNKSCSKQNKFQVKKMYSLSKQKKRSADFLQTFFIEQQNQLLQATTQKESSKQAQIIIHTINSYAQQGKISSAYNMIASVYVKLSKQIKKNHWQGQQVTPHQYNIRLLFENILITQSTTSSIEEFSNIINESWRHYKKNDIL